MPAVVGLEDLPVLLAIRILGQILEHLHGLADDLGLDAAEGDGVLEGLPGDVQGEVIRVDDALDKGQCHGEDVIELVRDE